MLVEPTAGRPDRTGENPSPTRDASPRRPRAAVARRAGRGWRPTGPRQPRHQQWGGQLPPAQRRRVEPQDLPLPPAVAVVLPRQLREAPARAVGDLQRAAPEHAEIHRVGRPLRAAEAPARIARPERRGQRQRHRALERRCARGALAPPERRPVAARRAGTKEDARHPRAVLQPLQQPSAARPAQDDRRQLARRRQPTASGPHRRVDAAAANVPEARDAAQIGQDVEHGAGANPPERPLEPPRRAVVVRVLDRRRLECGVPVQQPVQERAARAAGADDQQVVAGRSRVRRRLALEALGQRRAFRARPHQTHLALEDVSDLRQLVEMEPAQQPSHRRHPRVPPGRPDRPLAVLGAHDHRAELDDAKEAPATAQPRLAVQDGAAVLNPDRQRDRNPQHQPEGRQQQESRDRDRQVEGVLEAVVHREALAGGPAAGTRSARSSPRRRPYVQPCCN